MFLKKDKKDRYTREILKAVGCGKWFSNVGIYLLNVCFILFFFIVGFWFSTGKALYDKPYKYLLINLK